MFLQVNGSMCVFTVAGCERVRHWGERGERCGHFGRAATDPTEPHTAVWAGDDASGGLQQWLRRRPIFRISEDILQLVERSGSPELLPIFRSRQQAELLADILDDPEREQSLADLTRRLGIPTASIHREIERAERAGIVRSRRVGKTRLVRADTASPYFAPLRQLLVTAFGVPARLRAVLEYIDNIDEAYIYGSWAARWHGEPGLRPVGDIDLLVLGHPDRTRLYAAVHEVGLAVGWEIQVQIRAPGWLQHGSGSFHDTVASRPLVRVLPVSGHDKNAATSATARSAS